MKNRLLAACIFILTFSCLQARTPKYIFYFIGDGMSINSVYGAEMYKAAQNGEATVSPLTFSTFPYRSFISTYPVGRKVTDSSASGTALACGGKTKNAYTGMDSEKNILRNIAEDLKEKKGYGTGVVTTVGINHATPSVFYAHSSSRFAFEDILDQLLASKMDFAAGAGTIPDNEDESRCPAMIERSREAGWSVLIGKDEFAKATDSPRTICLAYGDDDSMPYAMQNPHTRLVDMTRAALANMMKYHPGRFFLMIEGGRIDYAAHENDAKCLFEEIIDMDNAVDVAMEFYKKHPDETLILVTSDHETGGLYFGDNQTGMYPERLLHQKVVKGHLTKCFSAMRKRGGASWEEARAVIADGLGLWKEIPVSGEEEKYLETVFIETFVKGGYHEDKSLYANNERLAKEAVDLLCRKAGFFFGSIHHTGAQVPLFAIGAGADRIAISHDNTDIPNILRQITGITK